MIVFANQTTGNIVGAVSADKPEVMQTLTLIPDGCAPFYFDDTTHPELQTNLGGYKIVSGYPVALTAAEIQAIADAAPPHVATTEERLTKAESENNKLRQQVSTNDDMLNGMAEYFSEKGLL